MEQHRDAGAGEMGDPRENPPTRGIIRHDSHILKSGGDPPLHHRSADTVGKYTDTKRRFGFFDMDSPKLRFAERRSRDGILCPIGHLSAAKGFLLVMLQAGEYVTDRRLANGVSTSRVMLLLGHSISNWRCVALVVAVVSSLRLDPEVLGNLRLDSGDARKPSTQLFAGESCMVGVGEIEVSLGQSNKEIVSYVETCEIRIVIWQQAQLQDDVCSVECCHWRTTFVARLKDTFVPTVMEHPNFRVSTNELIRRCTELLDVLIFISADAVARDVHHPHSALKTLLLRAAQMSSLTRSSSSYYFVYKRKHLESSSKSPLQLDQSLLNTPGQLRANSRLAGEQEANPVLSKWGNIEATANEQTYDDSGKAQGMQCGEQEDLPEEVVPAEELALATEALVREVAVAVVAAHALGVPRALQHVQQELVEDGLVAARARHDHGAGGARLVRRCRRFGRLLTSRSSEPMRVIEVNMKRRRNGGWGRLEIPEKSRRPTASSDTIPTCESPVTRSGIEPGSPWWEARVLIAQPSWPPIPPIRIRAQGPRCAELNARWPSVDSTTPRPDLTTSRTTARRSLVDENPSRSTAEQHPPRALWRQALPTSPHRAVNTSPSSQQGESDSIPGRVTPGSSQAGIVVDDAAVLSVFLGVSRFPRFCPALLLSHLILPTSARKTSSPDSTNLCTNIQKSTVHWLSAVTVEGDDCAIVLQEFPTYNIILHLPPYDDFSRRGPRCPGGQTIRLQTRRNVFDSRCDRLPVGSLPDFRIWEICQTILLVGGFSRGSPVSPALAIPR
ncbi:hypothetical protein PR048_012104 [Dryococelus australis]|uniref:Uncharacterized protein n=1 Tax=Dryococelus australis TaxID=614101 RepID=A0ABQ9HNG4_9NEOP|nr:hypothetical protein PR048_012104 [Dryococelus australis]